MDIMTFQNVEGKTVTIRDMQVLVDRDLAELYGVETRDINKAVKNNSEKFPSGYIIELSRSEKNELVENFHRFNKLKHSTVNPKVFTEKGLYMLATILKSETATQTTLAIVETFTKIRHLSRTVKELSVIQDKGEQKALMQKSGELIAEILDDDLAVTDCETSIELNFAVLKFKHTVKKKKESNK
ncbi:MAG: ORF6N domain-containing protein [Mariprofundaceae bacterium]